MTAEMFHYFQGVPSSVTRLVHLSFHQTGLLRMNSVCENIKTYQLVEWVLCRFSCSYHLSFSSSPWGFQF